MLILKLTHWTRDYDEIENDPEADPPEDPSLYVNAKNIIAMDSDLVYRPLRGPGQEKLERVTRLVLTEHVHEQVIETPEQILELISRGVAEGGFGNVLRVKGYAPEKKEDTE